MLRCMTTDLKTLMCFAPKHTSGDKQMRRLKKTKTYKHENQDLGRWDERKQTMRRGVQGLVSSICKKPADPYQPTASCSPNYFWCDNYSPALISHLIAKVYFLLSRAQFNSSKPPPFPRLTSAPQLRSYQWDRLSQEGLVEITHIQLSVTINWWRGECTNQRL